MKQRIIKHKSMNCRMAYLTHTKCNIVVEGEERVTKCWKDVTCKNCLKSKSQR